MTLTAHAIVGAGIATIMPTHPVLGICTAFASHFALDALPHRDYQIRSASITPKKGGVMRLDRALVLDLISIGTDFAFGFALATTLFATTVSWPYIICAAFAGMLPDALQFAYLKWPHQPLVSLQRFHEWIHTSHHMRAYPILGWISQASFLGMFVIAARSML